MKRPAMTDIQGLRIVCVLTNLPTQSENIVYLLKFGSSYSKMWESKCCVGYFTDYFR